MITSRNLIRDGVADCGPGEFTEPLLIRPGLLLERIVSRGCPTPADQWYDQPQDEWVMLAAGTASLEIEPQGVIALRPGDHLMLPAHVRHRVTQVSPDAVWLALHLAPE